MRSSGRRPSARARLRGERKARPPGGTSPGSHQTNGPGDGTRKPKARGAVKGKHCSWTPCPDGTVARVCAEEARGINTCGTRGTIETPIGAEGISKDRVYSHRPSCNARARPTTKEKRYGEAKGE